MIPTHQSEQTKNTRVVVNRLSTLTDYDFSNPHRHEYFEFFCFVNGGGKHEIDFTEVPIQSYSMHIVAPGQVHCVNRDLDSNGFVFLFQLEGLQAPQEIASFLFDHICHDLEDRIPEYLVPEDKQEWFDTILNSLWEDYTNESNYSALQIRTAIQQLCLKCMEWDQQNSPLFSNDYAQFRRMLFQDFRSKKKVKDFAAALNMTEKSLNEMVKEHTGNSASRIIYNQIVLEAKRLLLTGISAKEAAYELGFDDPAHFSKFFKAQTGQSPSEFRNVHVEG
ncbi:helix-turn-helix domain-containing protein [Crocinitomicaceae bacterium]|nr:helix-turn-helix domain-containing protein [Crocinitomicaceae bacterium]